MGIAGGAPRAENMKGKVLIYQIEPSQLTVSATLPQPKNAKMGSYFGSVLCAVDLDKDGYTDILVGAPFYSDVKDEGHVFVYMNNKNGALNLMPDMELSGDKIVGARFGSAIANVGSLNNDKYDDVAIGAPYEDKGAVYIYHGKANGIETKYRQKILASQVNSGLSLFGHSISGGLDVDDNGYPDMAVGSYGSDKAVLLKTQKVINIKAEISLSVTRFVIENNKTECKENDGTFHKCLNVTVCFTTMEAKPTDLNITYKIELDQDKGSDALRRMYFYKKNSKRFMITDTQLMRFSANRKVCLPVHTVHLRKKSRLVDLLSVLTFDVSFDLAHSSCKTNPNELCPVLNDYMPKLVRAVATFQKQCRSNDICKPDLSVTGKLIISGKETDTIHIGTVNDVTLMIDVKNKAPDAAYLAQVVISYPSTFDYIGPRLSDAVQCTTSAASNGSETATCTIGNPLNGQSNKTVHIKFGTSELARDFSIGIQAKSVNVDQNENDNSMKIPVVVKFEADLEVLGSSVPDEVIYQGKAMSKDEIKIQTQIGPKIAQTIIVQNKGPSKVDGAEVQISVPSRYIDDTDSYLLYLLQVELTGASGSCRTEGALNELKLPLTANVTTSDKDSKRKRRSVVEGTSLDCRTATCKSFKCVFGLLKAGEKAEVTVRSRLWQSTFLKKNPGTQTIQTTAIVSIPDKKYTQPDSENDKAIISVIVKPPSDADKQKEELAWWVYFLAVLGGVLLLGIAAFILYKFGFFKRKRVKDISSPEMEQ
ncbi:integrin alpha pat-2 isoform X2 [Exaiptasia diaphana]|uniref:Integrin alpha-2 domain-containing protein n=1 Tax=Exaiptasia diaphana TaxID=2652724 RepID=A0A913XR33_EXADI|nr:integrin alpha pat-2 isoform X2 [Exaiptasia diaphana]